MSQSSVFGASLPLASPIDPTLDPVACFLRLRSVPHCLFLDSALRRPRLGRYSFITADPFAWWEFPVGDPGALPTVNAALANYRSDHRADLPPFQGGVAGLFAYDLLHSIERVPRPGFDEFGVPALAAGLYDVVVAFDHQRREGWIISQGFPETDPTRRHQRAKERLAEFQQRLDRPIPTAAQAPDEQEGHLPISELAPQFATRHGTELTSNFTSSAYIEAVRRAMDYIRAGDLFQVNLSQRLLHPASGNATDLYLRLRERNPAPFAGFLDGGSFQIVSASPERFVQVHDRQAEARPIKGTRHRSTFAEASLFAADELRASEKDRAENIMIVDLLRNDLSRVCEPHSVCVTELCQLEVYEYVQHLVSAVVGRLRADVATLDLLEAAFPGGSITGAPKVRAMEIIAELEPTARGAYCGSLGYVGFDGNLDLNILIRTITASRGWWQMPVGGGIIAQSDPEKELDETWHKAIGLLKSLMP